MLEKMKKLKKEKMSTLDCKECCRQIPDFIQEKMRWENAKAFLSHLKNCENCREELELIYLIQIGLDMENEGSYNLTEDMENLISEYRDEIQYNQRIELLKKLVVGIGEVTTWLLTFYWFMQ